MHAPPAVTMDVPTHDNVKYTWASWDSTHLSSRHTWEFGHRIREALQLAKTVTIKTSNHPSQGLGQLLALLTDSCCWIFLPSEGLWKMQCGRGRPENERDGSVKNSISSSTNSSEDTKPKPSGQGSPNIQATAGMKPTPMIKCGWSPDIKGDAQAEAASHGVAFSPCQLSSPGMAPAPAIHSLSLSLSPPLPLA